MFFVLVLKLRWLLLLNDATAFAPQALATPCNNLVHEKKRFSEIQRLSLLISWCMIAI